MIATLIKDSIALKLKVARLERAAGYVGENEGCGCGRRGQEQIQRRRRTRNSEDNA